MKTLAAAEVSEEPWAKCSKLVDGQNNAIFYRLFIRKLFSPNIFWGLSIHFPPPEVVKKYFENFLSYPIFYPILSYPTPFKGLTAQRGLKGPGHGALALALALTLARGPEIHIFNASRYRRLKEPCHVQHLSCLSCPGHNGLDGDDRLSASHWRSVRDVHPVHKIHCLERH